MGSGPPGPLEFRPRRRGQPETRVATSGGGGGGLPFAQMSREAEEKMRAHARQWPTDRCGTVVHGRAWRFILMTVVGSTGTTEPRCGGLLSGCVA